MEGIEARFPTGRHARHSRFLIAFSVLVLAALGGCRREAPASGPGLSGKPEPVWALNNVQGKTVRSQDFAGRPHMVVFWASWCEPCHMEAAELVALRQQFAKDSFEIIGLSVDEDAAILPQTIRSWGITYPIVGGALPLFDSLHFDGIPRSYVVDRKGIVREEFDGMVERGLLAAAVVRALK